MNFKKLFLTFSIVLTVLSSKGFSLEYQDLFSGLSDTFRNFVDPNAGTTTFPSLTIPSGGREESLGQAMTGLADDISFFEYNPAGSSVMDKTQGALFHNSWIADSNMETLAGTIRLGNLGLGAKLKCFYVPFTQYDDFGDRGASSYYSETTAVLNASYNFFNGYYFKGLAVGANLKASFRSIPDYQDTATGQLIANSGIAQSGLALMGDLGVLLRFNAAKLYASREPNLKIGVSLINAGIGFTGFTTAGGVVIDDPLPTSINAGFSYRIIKPLAITADFSQPINFLNFEKSGQWSVGAGIDVNITSFIEVMAGFRLKGANPRFSIGTKFDISKVAFDLNYTFDLTSSTNPVNRFSVAARVDLGDRGRAEIQKKADAFYEAGLTHYAKGELELAVAAWKNCLDTDPSFDPAKVNLKAIEQSQKLYDRVFDIQTLE